MTFCVTRSIPPLQGLKGYRLELESQKALRMGDMFQLIIQFRIKQSTNVQKYQGWNTIQLLLHEICIRNQC
jgi:hypothetical protein